jgi:DNA-binding NarL/FixJ family response regulator
MKRLIFIDDDKSELDEFGEIVGSTYDYVAVHWPSESSKLFGGPVPDIFVCDLYLSPESGDNEPTHAERKQAFGALNNVATHFSSLAANRDLGDKERLKKTMQCISEAYGALELQWASLGQSPSHGIALLSKLRKLYPSLPVVFYSRKITPEDVISVLKAGAVDAIRKGALQSEELLARLAFAQNH